MTEETRIRKPDYDLEAYLEYNHDDSITSA